MKILIDTNTLNSLPGFSKVPLECKECKSVFYRKAKDVRFDLQTSLKKRNSSGTYCSNGCKSKSLNKRTKESCGQCGKEFLAKKNSKKNSKSDKVFCSRSCAVTYNNTHKTTGTRRSKLEIWLELKIATEFPTLEVVYNHKEAIGSELDIYFPSLKLAFELNGIVHYEPIYGKDKFESVKNNDNRKFQACLKKHINLVTIDTSGLIYFKPQSAEKYWYEIKLLVEKFLSSSNECWVKIDESLKSLKEAVDKLNLESEELTHQDDIDAYQQYIDEGIDPFNPPPCQDIDVRELKEAVTRPSENEISLLLSGQIEKTISDQERASYAIRHDYINKNVSSFIIRSRDGRKIDKGIRSRPCKSKSFVAPNPGKGHIRNRN